MAWNCPFYLYTQLLLRPTIFNMAISLFNKIQIYICIIFSQNSKFIFISFALCVFKVPNLDLICVAKIDSWPVVHWL